VAFLPAAAAAAPRGGFIRGGRNSSISPWRIVFAPRAAAAAFAALAGGPPVSACFDCVFPDRRADDRMMNTRNTINRHYAIPGLKGGLPREGAFRFMFGVTCAIAARCFRRCLRRISVSRLHIAGDSVIHIPSVPLFLCESRSKGLRKPSASASPILAAALLDLGHHFLLAASRWPSSPRLRRATRHICLGRIRLRRSPRSRHVISQCRSRAISKAVSNRAPCG